MNLSVGCDRLKTIPLFRGFNETECRQIADIATVVDFSPGEDIVKQYELCQNLWVLIEGRCEVVRQASPDEPKETIVLALLEPPNHFGEMSFFHKAPHSANVRAKTPVRLLRITHGDYQDMIDEGVGTAYKLAYNVVESLAERLRRMDEWVAQLKTGEQPASQTEMPEWMKFRDKLFNGWSL